MAKYKLYKELLSEDNILSHVFLNVLPKGLSDKIIAKSEAMLKTMEADEFKDKRVIDITLKIEGQEVDCKKFFNMMVDQYDNQVKKTATELVQEQTSEKLIDITNKIFEFNEIIEEMAKDINWEYDYKNNPFQKSKTS